MKVVVRLVLVMLALALFAASGARAQTPPGDKPSLEIYGFGQVDAIASGHSTASRSTAPKWSASA